MTYVEKRRTFVKYCIDDITRSNANDHSTLRVSMLLCSTLYQEKHADNATTASNICTVNTWKKNNIPS